MQFSYMLHFFAVISAISVLAAPMPDHERPGKLFDFTPDSDKEFSLATKTSKKLARGDWLRTAHPPEVWIISNQTCTYLTYRSLKMSHRWISFFSNLYVISYAPVGDINWGFSLPWKFQDAIQNVLFR